MADIPGAVLAEQPLSGVLAQTLKQTGTPPGEEQRTRFKRNFFINTDDVGPEIIPGGPRRGRESGETRPAFIEFSDKLKSRYKETLHNHLQRLANLKNTDPALYQQILTNPNHVHDRLLVDKLTELNADPRSGRDMLSTVDERKLDAFLDTAEGMVIANEFLEYQTALKLFALGLHAANLPPGERRNLPDPMRIRLNFNQGVLNRFLHEVVDPHLGGIAGVASSIYLAELGFALGGPIGLAAGAVPPAVYGMFRTIQSLRREGTVLDLRQCSAAFQVINSNPVEHAYMKVLIGIDTQDYQDLGNNQIVLRTTRTPETTKNPHQLEYEILQALYTRQQYHETLGIPRERLDALPQQFLYAYLTGGQQEQTGTNVAERVQRYFNPNLAGIRDGAGNPQEILVAAVSVPNPAFNPALHGIDFQGNIRRYLEAQRKVMIEDINLFIRAELMKEESQDKVISSITERKQQLGEGGEIRRQRVDEITRRKAALEGDRTALTGRENGEGGEKTTLDNYTTAIQELQKARRDLDRELNTTLGGAYATLQDALVGLNAVLNSPATIVVNGVMIDSVFDREQAEKAWKTTEYNNWSIANPWDPTTETREVYNERAGAARQAIDSEYEARIERIKPDRDRVMNLIAKLNELQTAIETKEQAVQDSQPEISRTAQILAKLGEEFATVTGWEAALIAAGVPPAPAGPGVGLTEANLQTETLDQIMARVNQAHAANNALGWPETQNNVAEIRMRVVHAMIEARARQIDFIAVAAPGAIFTDLTNTALWNISENQLRTLTLDQINELLDDRIAAIPAAAGWARPTDPEIQNAIQLAQRRLQARSTALTERLNTTNDLIRQQEAEISGVTFTEQEQNLSVTENLLRREANGTLTTRANAVYTNRADYADGTLVAGNMSYTEAERNLNLPRGYYELLDVLFDYKTQTQRPRDEYFRIINRLLPPDRLSQFLSDELMLGTGPNLALTLAQMRLRMDPDADGRIDPYMLGRAFRRISYTLGQQALAI